MKPDCTYYELQLAEYTQGTLPRAACTELAGHLAGCLSCQQELAREELLGDILGSLPIVPRTTAVAVPGESHARGRSDPAWYLGGGLAAAIILAVVLVPGMAAGPRTVAGPAAAGDHRSTQNFTDAEIDQARRDVLATLILTADVLDHSRERTVSQVFGQQLPRAVAGSFNHLESNSRKTTSSPQPNPTGGNG